LTGFYFSGFNLEGLQRVQKSSTVYAIDPWCIGSDWKEG